MRKYIILKEPIQNGAHSVKKVMLYEYRDGVYVFLYDNVDEDSSAYADYWFEDSFDAFEYILEGYNIPEGDLIEIDDPLPYCQHDIITPIRVKGRNIGVLEWGKLEKLVKGKWIPIEVIK